jgi:predicted flap endonuclease-1-like 5' DNA nuclease
MDNLWVVAGAVIVALVLGGIVGYSLAYFRLRRLEERWRSFVARHKREVDIAQARANELAHQLEAVRAGTDSAELHAELERTQRSLADAEARAALLRPEVDALHHLLTEKEQEVLLLKESMRERKPAAAPQVEDAPRAGEPPADEEQLTAPALDEALVAAPSPEPPPSTPDRELPSEFAAPPSEQQLEAATTEVAADDAGEPPEAEVAEVAADDTGEPAEAEVAEVAAGDTTEPAEAEVAEVAAGDTTEPLEEEVAEVAAGDTTEPFEEEVAEVAAGDTTEPPEAEVAEVGAADASLNGEDDLTAITGIGPVTARRLRHNGVTTFAQLAGLTDEAIDELAPKLKSAATRIRRDRWVEQARELAADRID